jgi:phage tail-like protein
MIFNKMKVYAMGRSVANDPLQKFKYRVSIPGLPSGIGFSKVSGLKREISVVEYDESGYDHTLKLAGREKVDNITCERGAFASKDLEDLYKQVLSDSSHRQTITITAYDRNNNARRSWRLAEAWVSKWEGPDFEAKSNDVATEKITIEFEYFLD